MPDHHQAIRAAREKESKAKYFEAVREIKSKGPNSYHITLAAKALADYCV